MVVDEALMRHVSICNEGVMTSRTSEFGLYNILRSILTPISILLPVRSSSALTVALGII